MPGKKAAPAVPVHPEKGKRNKPVTPEEKIIRKIVLLRNEKVLLDVDLAELYGIETRVLKQAVRRNVGRFPEDFMFELRADEVDQLVSQNVIPDKKRFGGAFPFAFTETGIAMLSSVLKSEKAIEMNIYIMRTFVALRKMALSYDEVMNTLRSMRLQYDKQFDEIFHALELLMRPQDPPRTMIGFLKP